MFSSHSEEQFGAGHVLLRTGQQEETENGAWTVGFQQE
jgi:hypothetical protein